MNMLSQRKLPTEKMKQIIRSLFTHSPVRSKILSLMIEDND